MSDVNGWRVVNTAGELVPVRVWVGYCECGCKQSPTWVRVDGGATYAVNRDGEAPQRDIRRKIGEVYPCAEVRAPGEMTTAERVAAARADALREARDACGALRVGFGAMVMRGDVMAGECVRAIDALIGGAS